MEFIEAMKEVWMASEMRKREEEEWTRKMATRQWQQNMMERQGSATLASRNQTPRTESRAEAGDVTMRTTNFQSELRRVLGEMSERLDDSLPGDSHGQEDLTMPPDYNVYKNFAKPNSQTEVKQPLSTDENRTNHLGSSTGLRKISEENNDPSCVDNGGETMTSEEKDEILNIIKKLSEEQSALKTKISEHDKRLATLLTKKPSIRRRISASASQIMLTSKMATVNDITSQSPLTQNIRDEDRIYAQIEQLYANLCRIHFPLQQKTATQCLAMDETQIYSAPTSSEMVLIMENKELKDKISALENQLKGTLTIKEETDAEADNNIESLKYTSANENCTPVCYENLKSCDNDTTDVNIIPCPFHVLKRDVQQISSTFEWNIQNYFEKLELEKWGKQMSTLSQPFHIGQYGYLARLEVFLNGNGSGYDKCMSIFLRIIKGEYDEYLQWPAMFSLTFILVNQEGNSNESLMHGKGKEIFKFDKPSGDSYDECDSWGLIEFVPHSVIHKKKYIKDDTIKLKVVTLSR